ncbi:LacI family DNA-binding transcriptional regulator [Gryllotalpicola koreensis]|uniref:LacI family DNA-binding transcriptional regulator n=1 Tax=Gryllotalpicola koreensis TaxID=993086 RepID=A0ABP7ZTM8_9MICO
MSKRLAEVAKKVGVSEATVSRVLNGKPGVSEATRQQVLTALDVLGYERPTKLRGQRARLVGLVLPELQNPIFPAFADIMGGALAQNGYTPVLCTQTAGGVSEADYVDLLLQQQVSGVVFAGGLYTQAAANHAHYDKLREVALPTVLVSAPVDGLGFPTVSCDDWAATDMAVNHLIQLGHTRIGFAFGPTDHMPSRRKAEAAQRAMTDAGLELPTERMIRSLYSVEAGQAAGARLIRAGVTAIVCASDPIALGVIRAARKAGLSVPGDLSVIGYDDSALMGSIEPPLTTVRQPIDLMGKMALELLLGQMTGVAGDVDEFLFEPELVVRSSTGPAPKAPRKASVTR